MRRSQTRRPFEDIFRSVGREVVDQLFVDRQIRRQHKEIVEAVRQVQVADELTQVRVVEIRRRAVTRAGEIAGEPSSCVERPAVASAAPR